MNAPEFSVGEWVKRRMDGKVGRVAKLQEAPADDFYFYVDFNAQQGRRSKDEDLWAGTTAAWERAFNLHAHSSTSSRDCDGTYSSGHVYEMTLEERCYDHGDLKFKERVMVNIVSLHSLDGTLKVTEHGLEWHEVTEEGYRAADVRWCEDDCPRERSWQRDHRAESMGY